MRGNTLFWGSILILAGFLFLLSNLGILQINVWSMLWPLFLIALGISFLWGAFFRRTPAMEHANVPLEGAARARVHIGHGAGRLEIGSGAVTGDLAEGEFGGGLDLNTRREGDLLHADLKVPVQVFPFFWTPGFTYDWRVQLTSEVPLSLDLDTGAGESRLDLSDLQVKELSLKSGASSTEIVLPSSAGVTKVRIETGAASVRISLPEGVAARIRAESGLSSISIDPNRFPLSGQEYQSLDYETAANRADIQIKTGVGSVEVR